uniref:serine/Arginine-related protein 53 isoform X5 n=1 Tax=Callithrix jacchus TaxID=9483 RepID=UPI0023DD6045|nr:serine/Arginine-related protein 53 isoform X5 [Callithrix jacchus]
MTITTTTKTITLSSPTFIAFGINKIKINKPAKQTPNKKLAAFTIYFLGIPTAWQPLSMHSISRLMLPGARTRKALSLNWSKYGGGLRRPDLKKSLRVCGVCKSTESVRPKVWTQKWDVGHQILKKKAEAREKRNTVGGPPRAVLQIVEHTAERKEEGNQDQSQDLGPEIFSLAHILMIEDAGIDQAVALLMALEGNEVEVVQGVEGNPIEFRGLGQKAEQEEALFLPAAIHVRCDLLLPAFHHDCETPPAMWNCPGQDRVHVLIVVAVKGPVIEERVVGLGIENDVKAEIKRREKRRRIKGRTRNYITLNVAD